MDKALKVLSFPFSYLVDKGRDKAAQKFSGGDVTDLALRKVIIRDMEELKSRCSAEARKELLVSSSFLKEGLELLLHPFRNSQSGSEERAAFEEIASTIQNSSESPSARGFALLKGITELEFGGLVEGMPKALEMAKGRFREAGREATKAFVNEALSIHDRLHAMEYRVICTLLEFVDNPKAGLKMSKVCLEELHAVSTVKNSFNVALKKGLRASFRRKERGEVIASVCQINRMIYDFANLCCAGEIVMLPCVDTGKEKLDPLRDGRVAQLLKAQGSEDSSVLWSFGHEGENQKLTCALSIATDNDGNFLIADRKAVKVFDHHGNFQTILRHHFEANSCECYIATSYTDSEVFVLEKWLVHVFNESANLERTFSVREGSTSARITASCDKVFILRDYSVVDVYLKSGDRVRSFGEGIIKSAPDLTASKDGYIMVVDSGQHCVHKFTVDGQLLKTFQAIGQGETYYGITCDAAGEHVIVSGVEGKTFPIIDVYSTSGDFVQRIQLDEGKVSFPGGIAVTLGGHIAIALAEGCRGKVVVV